MRYPALGTKLKVREAPAFTDMVPEGEMVPPDPADAVIVWTGVAASWLIVKVLLAMAIPAALGPPVFAATEITTVPFPEPLWPDVIVTHETPLDELHEQPWEAATPTVALPPALGKDWLVGEME